MIEAKSVMEEIMALQNTKLAAHHQRFFKTGKGEYGEGDRFLGIKVPPLRAIAKKYYTIDMRNLQELISSKYHEIRLVAIYILVLKYKKAKTDKDQKTIYDFYLAHTKNINNWDLVDASAHYIVGPYLFNRDKAIIYKLAASKNLWERRIAMMTTFHFIKNKHYDDAFKIAELLLQDQQDLIHKAVGWMLREIGKRNKEAEEKFLSKYYRKMPRTMLRYAIEKFTPAERKEYLTGTK